MMISNGCKAERRRHRRTLLKAVGVFAAAAVLIGSGGVAARAQSAATANIVVGYNPGGGNDLTARIVAEKLSSLSGRSFIVENKPGAASRLAAEYVSKAKPDGTTLLASGNSALSMAAAIYPDLAYDPLKDLVPIAVLADYPALVLIVPTSHPAKTLPELIAWSKENPNASNYAAVAQAYTIPTEILKLRSGLSAAAVSYKSSSEALAAIVGDKLTFMMGDHNTTLPSVKSGQARALAVTGSKRIEALPDVPSMGELGYPDVKIELWTGLFAPAGTSQDVADKLAAEVSDALADETVAERLANLGVAPGKLTRAAFGEQVASEIVFFKNAIKETGLKFE